MSMALFAGGVPGPFEVLLILFVILLLFGAKKLPELSRSLGKSLSEFKKGKEEGLRSLEEITEDKPKAAKTAEAAPTVERTPAESKDS